MKNGLYWGLGIVILGVVAVYLFGRKDNPSNNSAKGKAKTIKYLSDLVKEQVNIDSLTSRDLTEWFKLNQNQFPDSIKMIIAVADKKTLNGLGYELNCEIDEKKNIVQFFYDDKTTEVLLVRLIKFESINSALQARLLEGDGMIVVEK